ncbi:sensor histidine kinase [Streptomyces sp. NPDC050504]|uniref:sensor histidine kinase n=1 Tax=Streptomyces sp. NPDC050504 TaxID=3365618 RepID=UPI0037BBD4BF
MEIRGVRARLRSFGAARPWAVDSGVALLVQLAMSLPFVVARPADAPAASWPAYGLTTLMVVPLVWRRRAPLAALVGVLAAGMLYKTALDGPGQPLPYTGLVVLYTLAALAPPARRLAGAALVALAVPVSVWLNTRSARELTFSVFVFAAAYVLGRLADATRRAHLAEAERAAARERARIAREMHDILSHAVSLMIVQAEAGPVAVRAAPERAEAAFDSISAAGRDAMVQLRRLLGVLREDEEAPRGPQPSLDALPALVARVAEGSGLAVSYASRGAARPVPSDAQTTVYRVVQEALTNVVRHARARTAEVLVEYGERELTVSVTDDGRGPAGTSGHGLIGVRERAAAHGGTAWAGPGPGGRGFRTLLTLPLGPAQVASREEVGA